MSIIENIKSKKIKVKDRQFSLVQHECIGISGSGEDISFSLQVSYKDLKKSKGFVNDSFYLHNKDEVRAVINLLLNIYNDTAKVMNKIIKYE